MKKDFVNLKGNKLEIRWIGELVKKSEPVIVFLHEGLGCVDLWRDFPATLYKTLKIPSLLYSRQGYGRSSPSKVPKSPSCELSRIEIYKTDRTIKQQELLPS